MERYGRGQAPEGSQSDPAAEWPGQGGETGLEESMWQLVLAGGGETYPERPGEAYPERPDEPDCIYYLRTGYCGYGAQCRFNHPRDRSVVAEGFRPGGEYPERMGQPVCQYYMRTGMCKFGASCKWHHPRHGSGSVSPASLNYYGYPLRPGEKECSYYVKTGHCKFGGSCKFHHPQPAGIQVPTASLAPGAAPVPAPIAAHGLYPVAQSPSVPSSQQYGVVPSNWQVVRHPPLLPSSYLQGAYGHVLIPGPGMVPFAGWSPYPTHANPVATPSTQPIVGSGPLYGITQLPPPAPAYTGTYPPVPSSVGPSSSSQREHTFPERPGQPECQYYMKTGECKYGSSCRYHHPPESITHKTNCSLSPMNLPLRPGAPPCTYYEQHGVCKFGPTCKYDHPMGPLRYSPSASSLADMPVAPYPVGSSVGTLAPSSSSSELRPELISGSSKDSSSTRMSSSMSTASVSVGLIFSKGGPVPQSSVQQSGHSSGPSTGSSSTEARTSS